MSKMLYSIRLNLIAFAYIIFHPMPLKTKLIILSCQQLLLLLSSSGSTKSGSTVQSLNVTFYSIITDNFGQFLDKLRGRSLESLTGKYNFVIV